MRGRDKSSDLPYMSQNATLVMIYDFGLYHFPALQEPRCLLPGFFLLSPAQRKDNISVLVSGIQDIDS
jgi:hypothetical protein